MSSVSPMAMDVVIVGAGHAGGAAALALRELGFAGSLALVGTERHLPHERPPLSKEALQSPDWRLATLASTEAFAQQNIMLFLGERVIGADADRQSLTLASGRVLSYGSLVIATGSSPRRLRVAEDCAVDGDEAQRRQSRLNAKRLRQMPEPFDISGRSGCGGRI